MEWKKHQLKDKSLMRLARFLGKKNRQILEAVDDLDDVVAVHTNAEM